MATLAPIQRGVIPCYYDLGCLLFQLNLVSLKATIPTIAVPLESGSSEVLEWGPWGTLVLKLS